MSIHDDRGLPWAVCATTALALISGRVRRILKRNRGIAFVPVGPDTCLALEWLGIGSTASNLAGILIEHYDACRILKSAHCGNPLARNRPRGGSGPKIEWIVRSQEGVLSVRYRIGRPRVSLDIVIYA